MAKARKAPAVRTRPAPLRLGNREARKFFLDVHGLTGPRGGTVTAARLEDLIDGIGFVQLDTINTVARSHDMILFARAQNFKRQTLAKLHKDARLFEHYTHDASLIPIELYPYWQHRFQGAKKKLMSRPGIKQRLGEDGPRLIAKVRNHVRENGPTMTRDLSGEGPKGEGAWWGWSPAKTALEVLYRTGELAVSHRESFHKVYDLAERVIPQDVYDHRPSRAEMIDVKCRAALERIGFGTAAEIGAYWQTFINRDVAKWAEPLLGKDLIEIEIEGARGEPTKKAFAFSDLEDRLQQATTPTSALRFLSPFDPLVRDRKRVKQLYGFDYRIEIFVPAAKRTYGYYVMPILEGDRIIGRADLKADRDEGVLRMQGLWLEPGVQMTAKREAALQRDLTRLAKFSGVEALDTACPVAQSMGPGGLGQAS